MNLETITSFFGWMTIINMVILTICTIAMITCKGFVSSFHQKLMNIPAAELNKAYFQYLANYKLLIAVFNVTPYIALRIISAS